MILSIQFIFLKIAIFNEHLILWINSLKKSTKIGIQQIMMETVWTLLWVFFLKELHFKQEFVIHVFIVTVCTVYEQFLKCSS